jgi:hypothetical protein
MPTARASSKNRNGKCAGVILLFGCSEFRVHAGIEIQSILSRAKHAKTAKEEGRTDAGGQAESMTRGQRWFATEASENRRNRFSFVGGRARRYDGKYGNAKDHIGVRRYLGIRRGV